MNLRNFLFGALGIGMIWSCGGGGSSSAPASPSAPMILSFTATPGSINLGASVLLEANFNGGLGFISPGNIHIQSQVPVAFSPTHSTTYMLTVTGSGGVSTSRSVDVVVTQAKPVISSFSVNPGTITVGENSSLTAVFTGGTGLITPGDLPVTSGMSVSVRPAASTTYTLTVANANDIVTRTAFIQVMGPGGATIPSSFGIFSQDRVFFGESSDASLSSTAGASYNWSLIDETSTGNILLGQNTSALKFNVGNKIGNIKLTANIQDNYGISTLLARNVTVVGDVLLKRPKDMYPRTGESMVRLSDGRVLVCGGEDPAGRLLATAEIYDPNTGEWAPVGSMVTARKKATSVLLTDGRVLVAGGVGSQGVSISAAEIFDPSVGSWSATGDMLQARAGCPSVRLKNGFILLVGGMVALGNSCEVFNPTSNSWFAVAPMLRAQSVNTTLTLLNSGKVLVADSMGCEIYDYSTNSWADAPPLNNPLRAQCSAVLLQNGDVLIVGGTPENGEIYHPTSNTWTTTGNLNFPRTNPALVVLQNGCAMAIGGIGGITGLIPLDSTETYDPSTNAWTLNGSLALPCSTPLAISLLDGSILALDGSVEVYNPSSGLWGHTSPLALDRSMNTTTLLNDGRVLLAGGDSIIDGILYQYSEVFDPIQDSWVQSSHMVVPRISHATALLSDGRALMIGGLLPDFGAIWTCEALDPISLQWTEINHLNIERSSLTATTLSDGRVLVAGGINGLYQYESTCEVFDPATGNWQMTGGLVQGRAGHTALLLKDGEVLVIGGGDGNAVLNSAETYNSSTGVWRSAGSMQQTRSGFGAVLLQDGRVLVVGGMGQQLDQFLSSAEIYDPATNRWSLTGALSTGRSGMTVTLLPNGKVLVNGGITYGYKYSNSNVDSELFDPNLGTWTSVGIPETFLINSSAILMNSGKIFVWSGAYGRGLSYSYKTVP